VIVCLVRTKAFRKRALSCSVSRRNP
jgi:hypothetical protein